MPVDEHVLLVVRGWVQKAENDLKTSILVLRSGDDCPTDTAAFHGQQCAEKYLKAFLVLKEIDFPKTHDISELMARTPPRIRLALLVGEQRRLTAYATVTRYPGDYEPITLSEAKHAVALARRVRAAVRKQLPKEGLRREANR